MHWFPPDSNFSFDYLWVFSPHHHAFKQTPLKCQVGINTHIYKETSTIGAIFPPNTVYNIFVEIFNIQNLRELNTERYWPNVLILHLCWGHCSPLWNSIVCALDPDKPERTKIPPWERFKLDTYVLSGTETARDSAALNWCFCTFLLNCFQTAISILTRKGCFMVVYNMLYI